MLNLFRFQKNFVYFDYQEPSIKVDVAVVKNHLNKGELESLGHIEAINNSDEQHPISADLFKVGRLSPPLLLAL
jgi:hypothetical protein